MLHRPIPATPRSLPRIATLTVVWCLTGAASAQSTPATPSALPPGTETLVLLVNSLHTVDGLYDNAIKYGQSTSPQILPCNQKAVCSSG